MDQTPNQLALIGLGLAASSIVAAGILALIQMVFTHFVAKRGERGTDQKERDRAFIDLETEQLRDSSHWRELLQIIAGNTERRHSENVAAIDREARALDRLATEVASLVDEFRQWRGRQD